MAAIGHRNGNLRAISLSGCRSYMDSLTVDADYGAGVLTRRGQTGQCQPGVRRLAAFCFAASRRP